jgi:glutamine synthetase
MTMNAADVMKLIEEKGIKFVDYRFTDTRGKEQHVTVPSAPWTKMCSRTARCSTVRPSPAGRASRNRT